MLWCNLLLHIAASGGERADELGGLPKIILSIPNQKGCLFAEAREVGIVEDKEEEEKDVDGRPGEGVRRLP